NPGHQANLVVDEDERGVFRRERLGGAGLLRHDILLQKRKVSCGCGERCGEAGAIAAPAAVINAITDAIGTEAVAMPATPPTVWAGLQKERHAQPRVARDNGLLTGYMRTADGLPYPHISKQFPGKIDTTTPYVIGK